MTTLKCLYNKNLKMSPQKLAAQVGHVAANIGSVPKRIIVLKASLAKFEEKKQELLDNPTAMWYTQVDVGYTEVPAGTETVIGWVEDE